MVLRFFFCPHRKRTQILRWSHPKLSINTFFVNSNVLCIYFITIKTFICYNWIKNNSIEEIMNAELNTPSCPILYSKNYQRIQCESLVLHYLESRGFLIILVLLYSMAIYTPSLLHIFSDTPCILFYKILTSKKF